MYKYVFLLILFFIVSYSTAKDKKIKKTIIIEFPTMEPDEMPCIIKQSSKLSVCKELPIFSSDISKGPCEGIDVSHYQGNINWSKVAQNKDITYAYIKSSEGSTIQDDTYKYNIKEARKEGLKVGAYHFYRANVDPQEQLENMTSIVKKSDIDLLPIIDVERIGKNISKAQFVNKLKTFMNAVTKHYGRKPILYTFVNFYNKYLADEGFDEYKLMIAFYKDYEPELKDGKKYIIWQYSSTGNITGIRGDVDQSKTMNGASLSDILF